MVCVLYVPGMCGMRSACEVNELLRTQQVMATDMGEHMAIVSKLKTEIQKRIENPDDEIGDDPPESLRILVMQVRILVMEVMEVPLVP